MTRIESKNNNKIKDLIRLRDDSKFRNDNFLFYVEGERIFKDTPKSLIKEIYVKNDKVSYFNKILSSYSDDIIYILDDDVYEKVSDTVNSQGIIAVVRYNLISELSKELLSVTRSIVILDSVSDPGNLGTILRVSEAANVDLIILANNCCNIYNTKVIRASMSSIFRINIFVSDNIVNTLSLLKDYAFKLYATSLEDKSRIYTDANYKDKFAVVFGNEANGVSNEILNKVIDHIYIPMNGSIESLNVSVSISIILYEAMRQNNFYEN